MEPSELALRAGSWLRDTGPEADVVLSTRIRLARNVDGYPFPTRISPSRRKELESKLRSWVDRAELADGVHYCNLQGLSDVNKGLLVERHLISRELAQGSGDRGIAYAQTERVSVMTNEEDHVRIQVLSPGLCLQEVLERALAVDAKLERRIPYAFHEKYGYLTACPTNAGTGLRVSVMMHLPALVIGEQMERVGHAASRVGLTVRGFYGEGSKAAGNVFQISNQHTMGKTEAQILDDVALMVPKIVEYERGVRESLMTDDRLDIEDRVWRALAVLRYARKLSSKETMDSLSSVRLGVQLQMIPGMSLADINELFVITQPAHLQALTGSELGASDRDVLRAKLLRDRFKPEAN